MRRMHVRAQGMFVQQLWGSGMVDETEREALLEPVERLERRLLRQGAMGRSTMVYEVCCCMPVPSSARLHALFTCMHARYHSGGACQHLCSTGMLKRAACKVHGVPCGWRCLACVGQQVAAGSSACT